MAALTGILLGVVVIALLVLLVWSSALQMQDKLPEYQDRVGTLRDSVTALLAPRFVGESLDLSPAVVVLSLVFCGWLLGPVGALLAVPLSIGVKFLLESFAELRWLAYLMSDRDGDSDHDETAKA